MAGPLRLGEMVGFEPTRLGSLAALPAAAFSHSQPHLLLRYRRRPDFTRKNSPLNRVGRLSGQTLGNVFSVGERVARQASWAGEEPPAG